MSQGLPHDSLSDPSIVQLATRVARAQRDAAITDAVKKIVGVVVKLVSRRAG